MLRGDRSLPIRDERKIATFRCDHPDASGLQGSEDLVELASIRRRNLSPLPVFEVQPLPPFTRRTIRSISNRSIAAPDIRLSESSEIFKRPNFSGVVLNPI